MMNLYLPHRKTRNPIATIWIIGLLSLSIPLLADNRPTIGDTEFAQGQVSATSTGEEQRKLVRGNAIFNKDLVETGKASYTILEMENQSRIAMRELTRASIQREESANGITNRIKLVRGAVRGAAKKKDPYDVMVIDSPAGAVIIDEGEVTTHWCDKDCGKQAAGVQPVGKVHTSSAPVRAQQDLGGGKGKVRRLVPGDLIYEKESIHTGDAGLAILVFRDDMRMTLQSDSQVDINEYQYSPDDPSLNQVHIRLRQGRVRVKSGTVGQVTPDQFLVETPVNRVRVRGTGFDLHCVGTCANSSDDPQPGSTNTPASGLYISVWDGSILQNSDAGSFPLAAGQSSYVMNARTPPISLPRLPPRIITNQARRPDQIAVGRDTLFELNAARGGSPGLYVHVHRGRASVQTQAGDKVEVGTGRTGYLDQQGNTPVSSGSMPGFMGVEGSCQ